MERYLEQCLTSLVVSDELMARLEVIVVNDGSTDRTSMIAHTYASRFPATFVVIDKANGHYGSCINAGLKVATGRYIRVLDADDWVDTSAFAAFLSRVVADAATGESVDLYLNDYSNVYSDGKVCGTHHLDYATDRELDLTMVLEKISHHLMLPSVTYRTELVRSVNYRQSEGVLYSDLEWVTYPMSRVRRVRYLPLDIYKYRTGREGQSVSDEVFSRSIGHLLKVVARLVVNYPTLATAEADAGFRRYLDEKVLLVQLGILYQTYLLKGAGRQKGLQELRGLDDALKVVAPEIYAQSAAEIRSKHFTFGYVNEFRRKGSVETWRYRLFRMYAKIARLR